MGKEFKINLFENILDAKRDLTIIENKYEKRLHSDGKSTINDKWYKYHCNKCNNEDWIRETSLLNGQSCNACCNPPKKTVLGINTIWDTDRWMCDLGVSEEDAKRYTKCSGKKITVRCPDCGEIKSVKISQIYTYRSISCMCKDGFSYPEKFVYSILKQLNLNFTTELSKTTFDWCDKYRYDFYVPHINTIIETHGIQHYKEIKMKKRKTLQEEKLNDDIKKSIAMENGIKNYIVIDCRYSELEWIKDEILNSSLVNHLDFSKVDWNKCEEFALGNLIKDICYFWKNNDIVVTDCIEKYNLNRCTICDYLKKGTKLGWCKYDPKEELSKAAKKNGIKNGISIRAYKDNELIGEYSSISEACREIKIKNSEYLDPHIVSDVCSNRKESYKGYAFLYA